jgi:hypothetical protein
MKKLFFLGLLFGSFLLSVSVKANNMKQSGTAKTLYGSYVGIGPFDYSYPIGGGGWIIRVCGTVDFIDPGGFPHGRRTVTLTDENGNIISSVDEPFSSSNPKSPLAINYPEIEQAFQADISHLTGY